MNDYLPIFPDTSGPSRKDTTIKPPVKDNSCHSTPNLLASSPDSGIPQSSPHTPLSFQSESPVISSKPTTHSHLPRTSSINPNNSQSTSTGTTPRSRNSGTLRNIPREWYGKPYFFYYLFLYLFTKTTKNSPSHSKQILCYSTHLYLLYLHLFNHNICCFCRNTTSGVSLHLQHLVFLFIYNI